MTTACTVAGCGNKHKARGLCRDHYMAAAKRGDFEMAPCEMHGCSKPHYAHGLCNNHYQSRRKAGLARRVCGIAGCGRQVYCKGICSMHYERQRIHGDVAYRKIAESGAGTVGENGYRILTKIGHGNAASNGQIPEHRFMMAESLGRPLLRIENVHHKNGDRLDNRLVEGHELKCPGTCCNLELWRKHQPPGQRVADQLAAARSLIAAYSTEAEEDHHLW